MTSTLVDTNVLLDVIETREKWNTWAVEQLDVALEKGSLVLSPIVYAEASVPYADPQAFDSILTNQKLVKEELPWAAAFRAAKAFYEYRQRGGVRNRSLPDFFIGAHAEVKGHRLLTRDPARYRTYFPALAIIAPDTHP